MATKVFDNFLEDKYLDELNDYNIWQLVAKQDIKWVDIHSKPTNVFERIIKKEYHKISPLYNTFKGYEYWRVTLNSFNNPILSLHQDLDEILEERESIKKPASLSTVLYGYPHHVKGGNLQIQENEIQEYEPKYNRLICFDSNLHHQVLPVTLGVRVALSVNFWTEKPIGYQNNNFRVKKRGVSPSNQF